MMVSSAGFCVYALPFLVMIWMKAFAEAGCYESGLCCFGKNNVCIARGPRLNNKDSRTCFCDSECLLMGDCCTDYKQRCQPIDCSLSDWNEWSECDARCGPGVRQRSRTVIIHAANGGNPCDPLVEKAICQGTNCKVPRMLGRLEETKETGKIIPAVFGSWRKNKVYNPYQDIRRNLFNYYKSDDIDTRVPRCAWYELTEVRSSCASSTVGDWFKKLAKGSLICVECQPTAMKERLGGRCMGQGVYLRETRWSTMTMPGCNGKWIQKTMPTDCQCTAPNELNFILI